MRRNERAHKNDFGHVLVVAGSPAMLGAACLVSLAAMRAGAGLVTAAIPKALNLTLQKKISHAVMTLPVPGTRQGVFCPLDVEYLSERWNKFIAVALGPGLGMLPATQKFVLRMLKECPLPMVVDADALNALSTVIASPPKAGEAISAPRIFTPHPGEFFRLTGKKPVTDKERRNAAKTFAIQHGVVLVLKGHHTVVASPDGKVYMNRTGNPGMAKAGVGDVLTGMIAALLAQGCSLFESAKHGVYCHGASGDLLIKHINPASLTAVDLIDCLVRRPLLITESNI